MSFLNKLFGKSPANAASKAADAAELARQRRRPSSQAIQSDDERASVRNTMEAELDAARVKRADAASKQD